MRLYVLRAILCGLKRGARIGIGLPGGPHRTTCPTHAEAITAAQQLARSG